MRALFHRVVLWLGLALSLAGLAQAQESGEKDFLTRSLQDALSGAGRTVDIQGFKGALSASASFDLMTIADADGIWLRLEDVTLVWTRSALLRGRLEVDKLTAKRLDLPRLPKPVENQLPNAEAAPFALPELPVAVNINQIAVDRIVLGAPVLGEAAELSLGAAARLSDGDASARIDARRLDGREGRFEVNASFDRASTLLDLALSLKEGPEGIAARALSLPGLPPVALSLRGKGPLDDFSADLRLATEGKPRLSGQIALSAEAPQRPSDTPDRRIRADVSGDITALFAPRYRDFFGDQVALRLDALHQANGALDVTDFSLSARDARLNGQLGLNADGWPVRLALQGKIASPDGDAVLLPLPGPAVKLREAGLTLSYDASRSDALRAEFDLSDLASSGIMLGQSQLVLDGRLEVQPGGPGRFAGDLRFDAAEIALSNAVQGRALGDRIQGLAKIDFTEGAPLRIQSFELAGADYGLAGQAEVGTLASGFDTQVQLGLSARDLSRFAELAGRPLKGVGNLLLEGRVGLLSGQFDLAVGGIGKDLQVGQPEADKLLSAGDLRLDLTALRNEAGTFVRDLELRNPVLKITGGAELRRAESAARLRLALDDLAVLLPNHAGPVNARLDARQEGTDRWVLEAEADGPYAAQAKLSGALAPQIDLGFELSLPEVAPLAPGLSGPLAAQGGLRQAEDGYNLNVNANGPLGARAQVSGQFDGPRAAVTYALSLPDVSPLVDKISGPLRLGGSAFRTGAAWQVKAEAQGPAGTRADLSGLIGENGQLDLQARGSAPLGLTRPFIAPRNLQGMARFDLALRGAADLAGLSGRIDLQGASLSAPNLRLALRDIGGAVVIAGRRAEIDISGTEVNGGRMQLGGGITLGPSLPADLTLRLDQLVLLDPRLYRTALSGGLRITGPLARGAGRIAGQITVGETEISLPSSGLTSIGDIPPITHIGAAPQVRATQIRAGLDPAARAEGGGVQRGAGFALDVQISAPSRIYVRGRGLEAELGGALRLSGTTNRVISIGQFNLIRGRLDILSKRFDLRLGRILFQGDLIPYLRFVTASATRNGEVRVILEGPADAPEVTFESTPAAPQDEVLAQLLFGRKISEISAFQALQLANAVAVLAGRGGSGVIDKLRQGFGLDDLDLTTNDDGSTAVRAGKYISENVYTDVTANSDGTGEVSLNLDLTPNLTARGRLGSNGDSGIGIFFEKDY